MRKLQTAVAVALAFACMVFVVIGVRAQDANPADAPYSGSKMTRQQIIDKLTSEAPGTTVSQEKGKEMFMKVCAGCHIHGEVGTAVGPDLTTLASRFRKRDTLDSIMWPSRTISDQYAVTMLEMADGTFQSGVIIREDRNYLYVKNAENLERPLPVPLANIKERTESTVSLMPEGLMEPLTLDEIDSLVAYVLTQP